jgi:hypothetical protein
MSGPDEWLATIRKCQYLPEPDMKKLCEMVSLVNSYFLFYFPNNIYLKG